MKEILMTNKVLFSTIGGLIGSIFGELDGFLFALLVFMTLDYMTGLMAAAVEKKLASNIGFKGIFKKIVLLCLVAVGQVIDEHVLKQGGMVRTAIIFYYLSNEGLSIVENAARLGLPVPEKLKDALKQLKQGE